MRLFTELSEGLLGPIRKFLNNFLAAIASRFELFIIELQLASQRWLVILIMVMIMVLMLGLALLLFSIAVILAIQTIGSYILTIGASLTLAIIYGILAFIIGRKVHLLIKSSRPFHHTIEEIKKDIQCLRITQQ